MHFILHEIYIQLRKRDADLFGSEDLPIPPSCLFTVWADSTCNPEIRLRHPVILVGIDSPRKMYISRFLETTGISFCYYHKLNYLIQSLLVIKQYINLHTASYRIFS